MTNIGILILILTGVEPAAVLEGLAQKKGRLRF